MQPTMSETSIKDYLKVQRERYARRPGKQARSMLLDECAAVTGHERKHLIKVLADFCDGGGLERVTPEDGSLRRYVSAKKRSGGRFVLSLEEVDFAHHLACGSASPTGNSCMTGAWVHGILSF